jgi:hypothetical protein
MNRRADGKFSAEGWISCRCGKISFHRVWETTQELADARFKLQGIAACKVCEADVNQAMDMCPETTVSEGGVAACRLGYRHVGRCVPYEYPAELIEEARKRGMDG